MTEAVDQLNAIAEQASSRFGYHVDAVDNFRGYEKSILGRPATITTPPSIHNYVRLHSELEDYGQPFLLVNFWRGDFVAFKPLQRHIIKDTVLIGAYQTLRELGEEIGAVYRPVFFTPTHLAVRVESLCIA